MAGLNSDTKLLLHCDGTDGSTSFPDESDSNHSVTANATAQVDTAESKFGGASLFLDGNSDYLTIPDSPDWDVYATTTEDWTIDFWIKLNNTAQHHTVISQAQSGSERWYIRHDSGNGFRWHLDSLSATIDTGSGGEITDSNWHHVAAIKVANKHAVYVDGQQVNYVQDNDTKTFAGTLYIGQLGNGFIFLNGWLDEFRVQKSNYFNASPVSGLTDTITVPTEAYSSESAGGSRNQIIIIT